MLGLVKTCLVNRPILAFFLLTLTISWTSILLIPGPLGSQDPSRHAVAKSRFPTALLLMLLGPSIAGLIVTVLIHGCDGLRSLCSRLFRWRVAPKWWAVALFLPPAVIAPVQLIFALLDHDYLPAIANSGGDAGALLLIGAATGLFDGLLQELGWTGFAAHEMLSRREPYLETGLTIGWIWALWHFPITIWYSGDAAGHVSLLALLPPLLFYLTILPAYRLFMVWVYSHTGSVLVSVCMHASLTACVLFIFLPEVDGVALCAYYLVLALVFWILVLVVISTQQSRGFDKEARNDKQLAI